MADKCKRISTLSETDLAYIAGLIDGEGSIYVMKHIGKDHRETFYPAIAIMMADRGAVEWLASKLGLAVSNVQRSPEGWRNQISVRIHGKRAVLLAFRILPYLKVKAEQARLIQQFPFENRKGVPRTGRRLSPALVAARAALREDVNALNARGTRNDGKEYSQMPGGTQ